MAWIDVKKAYDSVDHGWLNGVMLLHRFPVWLCRVIAKLCRSWNTWVMVVTRKGREISEPIRFNKGLPQGDALYPRLFTVCLQPIVWTISATKGYKLSKPITVKVTGLLYIDDLKIFAAPESKLNRVMNMVETTMEDVELQWNHKKCAVAHVRRGVHVSDNSGMILDGTARIPGLEDGKQYKFLGVLQSVMQEDKLVLECAAKEYLRRMSVIWTSALSDYNRVTASNQFPLPMLGYLVWTQQWPIMDIQEIDKKARKIFIENGGRHPCGSNAIFTYHERKEAEGYGL